MLTLLAKEGDYVFEPVTINGPTAVGKGSFSQDLLEVACQIVTAIAIGRQSRCRYFL